MDFKNLIILNGNRIEKTLNRVFKLILIILAYGFLIVQVVEKFDINQSVILKISLGILLFPVLFLMGNIFMTWLHELSHKGFAKIFNYKTHIKIDIDWRNLDASGVCHFDKKDLIKRNQFIVILIAPFIIFCLMISTILLIDNLFVNIYFIFILANKLSGCSGDFLMIYQTFKKSSQNDRFQYDDTGTFKIIRK
ncbi:hypothetical protein CHH62_16950 [Niallia circulans]|nr:hypothetical protein CHH62_16950 [Niallia circulans]